MLRQIRKFIKRLSSDKADGMLVGGVLVIPFYVLLMGFSLDIAKTAHASQSVNANAQAAAQNGIRHIDASGRLTVQSVNAVAREYSRLRDGADGGSWSFVSDPSNPGVCRNVPIPGTGSFAIENMTMGMSDRTGTNFPGLPWMQIIVSTGNRTGVMPNFPSISDGRITSWRRLNDTSLSGGSTAHHKFVQGTPNDIQNVSESLNASNETFDWSTITVILYDTSPNFMLGMFGNECQVIRSEVSAIRFASQRDWRP